MQDNISVVNNTDERIIKELNKEEKQQRHKN